MVKNDFEKMFFEKNVSVELFFDDLYFFTFYIFLKTIHTIHTIHEGEKCLKKGIKTPFFSS